MSERERKKVGLHKKISSIFRGVAMSQDDSAQEHCETPAPKPIVRPELEQPASEPVSHAGRVEPEPKPEAEPTIACYELKEPEPIDHTEPKEPEHVGRTESISIEQEQTVQSESEQFMSETADQPEAKPSAPKFTVYSESEESESGPLLNPEPEKPVSIHQKLNGEDEDNVRAAEPLPKSELVQQPKANAEKQAFDEGETIVCPPQSFLHRIGSKLFAPKPGVNPAKQKAMVVMIPILFIVLIFMFRGALGTSAPDTNAAVENETSSEKSETTDVNDNIEWEIPMAIPTRLRDPMKLGSRRNSQTESAEAVELVVKGILYSGDNPSAVIGNMILYEGEKIGGATIVKINTDSVEFEMNGRKWTRKVR